MIDAEFEFFEVSILIKYLFVPYRTTQAEGLIVLYFKGKPLAILGKKKNVFVRDKKIIA